MSGVLTSTRAVTASSAHVRIDDRRCQALAEELIDQQAMPTWDADLHFRDIGPNGDERTAMWILVLDALNFCFWGQGSDPQQRWRVMWNGELVDGYVALVAALTRAIEHGVPLTDPSWLAGVTDEEVAEILAPADGHTVIPLFQDRVNNLIELGAGLLPLGHDPATTLIRRANGSAIALMEEIVKRFPSFRDTAHWPFADTGLPNNDVHFYKRAQILVGDLAGGLAGSPLAEFHDLADLTAFADYKVPQILRELGVLIYDDDLARIVDHRIRIAAGSRMEIEIRAATIVACDRIAALMRAQGRDITASELDWLLWTMSQDIPTSRPYHLTETIYY